MDDRIATSLAVLQRWLESEGYAGWDPFDALNSPAIKPLTLGNRWLGVAAVQLLKRSPVNLRPLLGVPKVRNAKAMGLLTAAYVRKHRDLDDPEALAKARLCADWLLANYSRGYSGLCWGYPFNWPNRDGYVPKETPTVVNTAFIGHALLDLYEVVGDGPYRDAAASATRFMTEDLARHETDKGFCFSYTPIDDSHVHNANMLGASLVARVAAMDGDSVAMRLAEDSISYSVSAQRQDGSWAYGDSWNQQWVDSFHTGYNLVALRDFVRYARSDRFHEALVNGYRFYLRNFFLPDGTVKYYDDRVYPLEAHAFAHAVICLSELAELDPSSGPVRDLVIQRFFDVFWGDRGYFAYRKTLLGTNRIPYLRWVEAWAFLALVRVAAADATGDER